MQSVNLGFINIQVWGLFFALAFLAGFFWILFQGGKSRLPRTDILNLSLLIFIGAMLGARINYGFFRPFSNLKDFLMINQGGFVFYGGLFGAVLSGWIYIKIKNLNFWRISDFFAPAAAIGIFIGRLGCFLANDHIGTLTKLPWGIAQESGLARHPIALYLSLNGLLLFLILLWLKKRIKKQGYLFLFFLCYYAITRFLFDFLRVGDPKWKFLFISQWISLGILFCVIMFICKQHGIIFPLRKFLRKPVPGPKA